jgi:hypothetical protein
LVWDGSYDRGWEEEVWKLKRGLGWHSVSSSPLRRSLSTNKCGSKGIEFDDTFVRTLLAMIFRQDFDQSAGEILTRFDLAQALGRSAEISDSEPSATQRTQLEDLNSERTRLA